MRIQRLDICGFKSFNDRVVISFDEGITGIVGPNGCGKSNVVDALRWVMGEQNPRQLRGGAMADLLFNGSESVGPAGMAEVSLTLLTDGSRELPAQYQELSEINIKRRLFRSGESEYRINNEHCRLMDITDLLLGTGAGKRAYSIIEQGKVGQIVNARPEERRALLEEAAGISRYRWRKQTAERKLLATEQNLLRVNDVVAELRRQLGSLERQARKAARYRKLKDQLRQLELHVSAMNWLALQARHGHLRRAVDEGQQRLSVHQQALASLQAERVAHRQTVEHAEVELTAELQRCHSLEKDLQRTEQLVGFRAQERDEIAEKVEGLTASIAGLQVRREALQDEEGTLAELLIKVTRQVEEDEVARAEAEVELQRAVVAENESRRVLDAHRHSAVEAGAALAAAERELAELAHRGEELAVRLSKLSSEEQVLIERSAELEVALTEATGITAETRQLKLRLEAERGEIQQLLEREQVTLLSTEAECTLLGQTLAAKRSRLQSLEDLRRSYEDYGEGVRTIMRARAEGDGPGGLCSLVTDAFETPAEIVSALEAYLGERLQQIVVEDSAAGLAAMSFLAERSGGRGTFIPLSVSSDPTVPEILTGAPGVVGRAAAMVRPAPGYEGVVAALLGRAWVVTDLDAALTLRAGGAIADLVTLGGEVLLESGVVTGGQSAQPVTGVLHQRREIEELVHEVSQLETRLSSAERTMLELRSRIGATQAQLRAVSEGSHEKEVRLAHHQQDVRRMTEQLHACAERQTALAADRVGIEDALAEVTRTRADLEGAIRAAQEWLAESRTVGESLQETLEACLSRVRRSQSRLTEIQVNLASDQERKVAANARAEKVAEGLRLVEDEHSAAQAALAVCHSRADALRHEETELAAALERLRGEVELARGKHADHEKSRDAYAAALHATDLREEEERATAELEQGRHGELSLGVRECEIETAHLVVVVRELQGVELELEISRFHLGPVPSEEQENRLRELKSVIGAMGEINLSAIEEHRALEERHENLARQQLDLQKGIEQLREAIGRIGRQSQRRFRDTFALVNERFGQVFPNMFGGGRASLALVGEDDSLDGGVEIFAQPPGKKLQSIDLLSGGEKALTAVALVFSIFLIKPTPFCLLDEVDAPLDDANVGRYLQALRDMSNLSQFIVITHNKRTMEAADTLYGVTMEEPGCSKLVSVRLNRPEASAA